MHFVKHISLMSIVSRLWSVVKKIDRFCPHRLILLALYSVLTTLSKLRIRQILSSVIRLMSLVICLLFYSAFPIPHSEFRSSALCPLHSVLSLLPSAFCPVPLALCPMHQALPPGMHTEGCQDQGPLNNAAQG